MTPGEWKNAGANVTLAYGFHESPSLLEYKHRWKNATIVEDTNATQNIVNRIFSEEKLNVSLHLRGTNFQIKIWEALLNIPEGSLVSYELIATSAGNPKATRAAALAIAKNPIAYLIPCHRVIRKMDSLHNYRWGATHPN